MCIYEPYAKSKCLIYSFIATFLLFFITFSLFKTRERVHLSILSSAESTQRRDVAEPSREAPLDPLKKISNKTSLRS